MSFRDYAAKTIKVGDRLIGAGQPIFLTAEIGAAHNGSAEAAAKMIVAAADAGCDGADIFMAEPDEFYWTGTGFENYDFKKNWQRLAFTDEEWKSLFALAEEKGIILYPTPLDIPSLHRAKRLGAKMFNINSDDANNYFYLKEAAKLGLPVTMHDINISLPEVILGVDTLHKNGLNDIILLHSTQESGELATLYASANLEVINTYRQVFGGSGVLAGCVEHTSSDFLIYAVAAMKPALISKHIQLCAADNGSDASISVDVENLNRMIQNVRFVEQAIGGGANQYLMDVDGKPSEWSRSRRKVIVSARAIPAGKVIEESDLVAKRPGNLGGVSPMEYVRIVGSRAAHDIPANKCLEFSDFENIRSAPYKYPPMEEFHIKTDLKNLRGA